MKINHIISCIDIYSGGPARSVTHIIKAMLQQNDKLQVDLNTLITEDPIINEFNSDQGKIYFHEYGFLLSSKSLKQNLNNIKIDLFHGHGLWQFPVHQMSKIARKRNIPYIITIRGMLEPWALQQGALKKKLALQLFQYKDLSRASCLHATAPMEVKSIRKLGLKNPVALIPNGVNISEFSKIEPVKLTTPKKILFLSRIHQIKGIENLIEAWSQIELKLRKSWQIEIIGNGDDSYINSLEIMIKKLQLQHQIIIKPPVFGKEKIKVYGESSLFVLPTFSENFGIVIAESLASYTPVITTKGAPWEELNTQKAGWWIDVGVDPLKQTLKEAMQTKESELIAMGKNGRKLVEDKYSMKAVAAQMIQLYEWVLNKREKPGFII